MTPHNTGNGSGELLPEHTPRMDFAGLVPDVFTTMLRLDATARKGVDRALLALVKIRASQINHCAYCLDMHTKEALAAGETTERIVQLSAWAESKHFYTAREIAAIELTEAVTVLTDGFVPDEVYARAAVVFGEEELAYLVAAIATINVWNRVAVTSRFVPGRDKQG